MRQELKMTDLVMVKGIRQKDFVRVTGIRQQTLSGQEVNPQLTDRT